MGTIEISPPKSHLSSSIRRPPIPLPRITIVPTIPRRNILRPTWPLFTRTLKGRIPTVCPRRQAPTVRMCTRNPWRVLTRLLPRASELPLPVATVVAVRYVGEKEEEDRPFPAIADLADSI